MPIFRDSLSVQRYSEDVYLFDYNSNDSTKQLIATSSCVFPGWKSLNKIPKESRGSALEKGGQLFCFYVRSLDGPYDYCLKIWKSPKVSNDDIVYPNPRSTFDGIVFDKVGSYFGVGCGSLLAFCKLDTLKSEGLLPDNCDLPFGLSNVTLVKSAPPQQLPYAAWEVRPAPKPDEVKNDKQEEEVNTDRPQHSPNTTSPKKQRKRRRGDPKPVKGNDDHPVE